MKPTKLTPDWPPQKKKLEYVVFKIFDGLQISVTTRKFEVQTSYMQCRFGLMV